MPGGGSAGGRAGRGGHAGGPSWGRARRWGRAAVVREVRRAGPAGVVGAGAYGGRCAGAPTAGPGCGPGRRAGRPVRRGAVFRPGAGGPGSGRSGGALLRLGPERGREVLLLGADGRVPAGRASGRPEPCPLSRAVPAGDGTARTAGPYGGPRAGRCAPAGRAGRRGTGPPGGPAGGGAVTEACGRPTGGNQPGVDAVTSGHRIRGTEYTRPSYACDPGFVDPRSHARLGFRHGQTANRLHPGRYRRLVAPQVFRRVLSPVCRALTDGPYPSPRLSFPPGPARAACPSAFLRPLWPLRAAAPLAGPRDRRRAGLPVPPAAEGNHT